MHQGFQKFMQSELHCSPESAKAIVNGNRDFTRTLLRYLEAHYSQAVLRDKISELKFQVFNYGASQAYSNGQLKQAEKIITFIKTLTKEN